MPWSPRIAGETAPLYIAIADAIAADTEAGRLAPGTRLPTHRALAATLGVDVTTVSRAYAEAHRRGLVVGHVGRGTYVRGARSPALAPARAALIDLTVNLPPEPSDVCDDAISGGTVTDAERWDEAVLAWEQSSAAISERFRSCH